MVIMKTDRDKLEMIGEVLASDELCAEAMVAEIAEILNVNSEEEV